MYPYLYLAVDKNAQGCQVEASQIMEVYRQFKDIISAKNLSCTTCHTLSQFWSLVPGTASCVPNFSLIDIHCRPCGAKNRENVP